MIERFNFYDIYGYLIPGVAMAMLLALPFGVATNRWPDTQLGSVAVFLVAAYIVGHFIQAMASGALPSKLARDVKGHEGWPSVLMLNPEKSPFGDPLRKRIADLVKSRFGITVDTTTELDLSNKDHKAIATERNNVFFLCRPIANKASNYAEQFQGLYVMMRGLFVGLLLGCAYYVGWLLWFLHGSTPIIARVALVVMMLLSLVNAASRALDKKGEHRKLDQLGLSFLAVLLIAVGEVVAEYAQPRPETFFELAVLTAALPMAAFRFYALYKYFATEFAKAVWTYFAVTDPRAPDATTP
jgi:hypothetical protein